VTAGLDSQTIELVEKTASNRRTVSRSTESRSSKLIAYMLHSFFLAWYLSRNNDSINCPADQFSSCAV
jgi:hypothetical protein